MELYFTYRAIDVYGFNKYKGSDFELDSYLALNWCVKTYRLVYGL